MKKTLNFDSRAGQFKTEVGGKKFYLGVDAAAAQDRKVKLVEFFSRTGEWTGEWNEEMHATAKVIAKGGSVQIRRGTDTDAEYLRREADVMGRYGNTVTLLPAITEADYHRATELCLQERIDQLEKLVAEKLGGGAVVGSKVSIHEALEEWHANRMATEIDPDTGKPTEHVAVGNRNTINLVKRYIEPIPLSALNHSTLAHWCKVIANRPVSIKTGKPIKRATVSNCLKLIRQWVKWASHYYGWRKPEDWHEATLVIVRRTKEERRDAIGIVNKYFTPEEVGTLWSFALPSERMLILLGLNFGYAQSEILNMIPADVAGEEVAAIRGKSDAIGRWTVWPETRELAKTEFGRIPKKRQDIANRWQNLITRVRRDQPGFKKDAPTSFKWMRKSGSSLIRKVADGETSSIYLSHGEAAATDDDILDVYAAIDWDKVIVALKKLREVLLPHIQAEAVTARSYIPRTKIDQIRAAWAEGLRAEEIVEKIDVSRATAYRYKSPPG